MPEQSDPEVPEDLPDGMATEIVEVAESVGVDIAMADDSALAGEHIPEWDRALMEMQHGVHGESDTHLLSYSASGTPEFAKERLRDAILSEGLFSQFDTIPSGERQQLREYFLETLQSDGWTVDSLADQIEQLGADTDDAERIARTETHELLADARERGYEERGDGDERFKWVGTYDDGRTTEACQWLLEQTNPKHGGDPVGLERLKELVQEAPEHDPDVNTEPREWTPHIQCRKTFVRHVEG